MKKLTLITMLLLAGCNSPTEPSKPTERAILKPKIDTTYVDIEDYKLHRKYIP